MPSIFHLEVEKQVLSIIMKHYLTKSALELILRLVIFILWLSEFLGWVGKVVSKQFLYLGFIYALLLSF